MNICFKFGPVKENGMVTVELFREAARYTREFDEDQARWMKLAIEAGKTQAKDELLDWLRGGELT